MSKHLTIKMRLIVTLTSLSILMIIIGIFGQNGLRHTNESLRTVYENHLLDLKSLDLIARAILLIRISNANAIISSDQETIRSFLSIMNDNLVNIRSNWNEYMESPLDADEKALAQQFFSSYQRFESEGIRPSMESLRKGDIPVAKNILETKIRPLFIPVKDKIDSLIKFNVDEGEKKYYRSKQSDKKLVMIFYSSILIGILLAVIMGRTLFNAIMRPLYQARVVAGKIAHGDITSVITVERSDEIGALLNDFSQMQWSLQEFVAAQNGMAKKHAEGWISARLEESYFPGTYGNMARELNNLVDSHIRVKNRIVEVIARYAQGDFSQDMEVLPGEKGNITEAINGIKQSLQKISNEIKQSAELAAQGNFGRRSDINQFDFMFRDMLRDLNQLIETCDIGFNDVVRVAESLAKADLTQVIDAEYPGLFGKTKDAVNTTVQNLRILVNQIKDTVDSISTAASQIAAGNQNLSMRTEEQATSLQETVSSMEQLTSTVAQNAENAKQANLLARQASAIASKGGTVVGEVIQTMNTIHESSRKIVDIIGVIDGIAFQTNILALNAAVEAARAGEQGRGFSVVAGEVRGLAQRAAAAAKEIKTLINDSVNKVENGSRLVENAGATMNEVVSSIQHVTGLMEEISASSLQQSKGIEQLNAAIGQMDQSTQQNAALVEQAAAAAESLHQQAESLATAIAVFKIDYSKSDLKNEKLVTPYLGDATAATENSENNPDFATARNIHLAWRDKLASFLEGKTILNEKQFTSHRECMLGKWIYSKDFEKYKKQPDTKALMTIHIKLHEAIQRVVQLKKEGNLQGAQDEYQQFLRFSNELVNLLNRLERIIPRINTTVLVTRRPTHPLPRVVNHHESVADEWREF